MTAGGGVDVRVSDAALETAMAAYVAYWQDDDNNKPCEECAGSGFVAVGTEGDRDYCGWCDCGYVNAGTEEGAVRAALTAAIAELIAADREYDEAQAAHERARKKFRDLDSLEKAWSRVLAATARRASALAALGENGHG